LDDVERPDPRVLQDGPGGVAEAEAADDDVEIGIGLRGERQPGELDLRGGEEARHEVLVAEHRLVDVHEEGGLEAAPKADLPHRCAAAVELLEPCAHQANLPSIETLLSWSIC